MIIVILIVGVIIGVLIAFIAAPIIVAKNRRILREMREAVEVYEQGEYSMSADREEARQELKRTLVALKAKMSIYDKQSFAAATDLVALY